MSTTLGIYPRVSNPTIITYRADRPQLRELLAQGVLAGVIASWVYAIYLSFFVDSYYKALIFTLFYELLGVGTAKGLAHGFAYWCYTRLPQARFRLFVRFIIATAVVSVAYFVLQRLYPSDKPVDVPLLAVWTALHVICFSVLVGSRWRPWQALVYGVGKINTRQLLPASVVGSLLRLVMLFACFQSTFLFVCVLQMNHKLRDFAIGWLVVVDFVIGTVIVLTNPRFWLALFLALLINAPWLYILLLYPNEPRLIKIIISSYLLLWCAFLLTRWRRLDPLFSSIREELRYYYLID
jgi:hypothetical protein